MSIKMKGLLKGLRYISHIFEEEEEKEMQIGFPTDVRHVAHIGWDGPVANAPTWIQNFKDGETAGGSPQNGDEHNNVAVERSIRLSSKEKRYLAGSDASTLKSPSRRRSDKVKGVKRHGQSAVGSSPDPDESGSENRTSDATSSNRRKAKNSSKSKLKPTS